MYYEKYATDKARYDREMEDYQRSKQNLAGGAAVTAAAAGGGGGGGGRGQSSSTPAVPAPATAAVSSGLPRVVEPLALTTAVQQTVPSLLLQAGEEVVPES
ncbi:MAG: hypothetical protein MJE68_15075 [Proteobacteria bacterium]|nr:hypothetical protein [Pseudomonadota bacterium]